ncbi:MAG: hypothetical protein OEM79_00345 [Nitrosopumilus sp.]|nr:hypothetical protein [Nitrosopumilus sp.]
MKFPLIVFLIISVLIIFPTASGQISNEESKQKSIEVRINSAGDVQVIHVINPMDSPTEIKLIDGEKSNLKVKGELGNDVKYDSIGKNESLMISPSDEFVIVGYDIEDQLRLIDNVWTWDFRYLESTIFVFPEQVDLVFVNNRPAYLGEARGITCHGCQMILEYSLDEPKLMEEVKIQDMKFLIETRTWGEKNPISFDPISKEINFEVLEKNRMVTTIIPVALMSEPYQVFLDGEKIFFQEYFSNGTHVWLNMRPQNSGEISITGLISPEITLDPPETELPIEYVIFGLIIIGIIIISVIFIKQKK